MRFLGAFFASQGILTTDTRNAAGSWRYGEYAQSHSRLIAQQGFWDPKRMMARFPNLTYPDGWYRFSLKASCIIPSQTGG